MNAAQQVSEIVNAGRSLTLDWLPGSATREEMGRAMVAMANTQGGTLVLGIQGDDKPDVIGLNDSNETVNRVLSVALSLDPALIIPVPTVQNLDGKPVVIATIPARTPHVYSMNGHYLHRRETHNEPLKPHELRDLLIARGEIAFESDRAPGTTLDDLDWSKVEAYARNLDGFHNESPRDILLHRGCLIRTENGPPSPTHAGILLFGKDPQRLIRSSEITAVRFAGSTMSDTFNRQDITGTLPDQIRKAETFLVDHLRKDVTLKRTMARTENYEYPMEAARELVVNAVAHRDYSIRGDSIRLFIFQDRMQVTSPGKLPGPVTIDNIKDERFSRNPVIVQVLSDMGFIERLGYGVDRVIELLSQQSMRAPTFAETSGGFQVMLYNQGTTSSKAGEIAEETAPQAINALQELLRNYPDIPINSRQERALMHLCEPDTTRITNSELQRMFPDVHAETIRRDLADLVTKDILAKMGQKRGSYYVLKRDLPALTVDDDAKTEQTPENST